MLHMYTQSNFLRQYIVSKGWTKYSIIRWAIMTINRSTQFKNTTQLFGSPQPAGPKTGTERLLLCSVIYRNRSTFLQSISVFYSSAFCFFVFFCVHIKFSKQYTCAYFKSFCVDLNEIIHLLPLSFLCRKELNHAN